MKNIDELKSAFKEILKDMPSSKIHMAVVGKSIKSRDPSFDPKNYGFDNLVSLLGEGCPDICSIEKDESVYPPRFFVIPTNEKDESFSPPRVVVTQKSAESQTNYPKHFDEFAYHPFKKFEDLAQTALYEPWGDNLAILTNYISVTYTKLKQEKKIFFAEKAAVFDTGLVDFRYLPIYAYFTPNNNSNKQPWYLEDFCLKGENKNGKLLTEKFEKLPEAAYYLSDPAEVIYNVAKDLSVDWEHIVKENVHRLPIKFLSLYAPSFSARAINENSEEDKRQYQDEFAVFLKSNNDIYNILIVFFREALTRTLNRIKWNYKTAIPFYSLKHEKLELLLPICLVDNNKADLAIVVEKMSSGNYQGHTCLRLDWAYKYARVVARPDSDWLTAESIV